MVNYLATIAGQLGISIALLLVIAIWSYVWKLIAFWKAARKGSVIWFVILALVNTIGILEILYIFVFSKTKSLEFKMKKSSKKISSKKKSVSKKRKR